MAHFVHHFRLATLFEARTSLRVGAARIRVLADEDARALAETVRKRNVFSRHAPDGDFYTRKARAFAGRTVVEIALGAGEHSAEGLRELSIHAEQYAFTAATLWLDRRACHRCLGVQRRADALADLYIEDNGTSVQSNTRAVSSPGLMRIDEAYVRRFERSGLASSVDSIVFGTTDVDQRLRRALDWLTQSRLEASLDAAVVKTTIGFETLLVLSRDEPVRATISSRTGSLLGTGASFRQGIERFVKHLYDWRSSIVHGRRPPKGKRNLDVADRLLLLAVHALAAHGLTEESEIQRELDASRSDRTVVEPFRGGIMRRFESRFLAEIGPAGD